MNIWEYRKYQLKLKYLLFSNFIKGYNNKKEKAVNFLFVKLDLVEYLEKRKFTGIEYLIHELFNKSV